MSSTYVGKTVSPYADATKCPVLTLATSGTDGGYGATRSKYYLPRTMRLAIAAGRFCGDRG
eukprot:1645239-Rhodomonas_salina.2